MTLCNSELVVKALTGVEHLSLTFVFLPTHLSHSRKKWDPGILVLFHPKLGKLAKIRKVETN